MNTAATEPMVCETYELGNFSISTGHKQLTVWSKHVMLQNGLQKTGDLFVRMTESEQTSG